ncbi:hypothetical protein TrST_g14048 [Triparma strigata]|uniref:RanBP2-type domain-containing protein n=1 Tax=Triparma strigata TaxID=1606541 RepID=A0A9W7EA44_9STRA|nr:hypothetical protein TrST_g14048 [Triparma strigata]
MSKPAPSTPCSAPWTCLTCTFNNSSSAFTSSCELCSTDRPSSPPPPSSAGLERDKRGYIIRVCGIAGCQYKTYQTTHMKNHKAAEHGIDVVWFAAIKTAANTRQSKHAA